MLKVALAAVLVAVAAGDHAPPQYTIHMETDPEHRWDEVCRDKGELIAYLVREISVLALAQWSASERDQLYDAMDKVRDTLPQPFKGEMEGLMRCTKSTWRHFALTQFFYDFVAVNSSIACTGIIGNTGDGTVLHGRNLDFGVGGVLTPALRLSTISVDWMMGGKLLYKYTGFAGLVGAWTGLKPGAFAVEGNERDVGPFSQNLKLVREGRLPPSMVLRQALIQSTTYNDVVGFLKSATSSASVYFIVSGVAKSEGTVITRSEAGVVDQWSIPDTPDKWYIVETNYDHWNAPPANDDRRATAIAGMRAIGSPAALNGTSLYTVMSTSRVLNTMTVFTAIMSAAHPDGYRAVVREPSK